MKLLARIPAVAIEPAAIPSDAGPSAPAAIAIEVGIGPPAAAPAPRPEPVRARGRHAESRLPLTSIAALAVLAAVAWSLASWNDALRLARSRQERLARFHSPAVASETVSR